MSKRAAVCSLVLCGWLVAAPATSASADPVDQASCVGVYSVSDAKGQNRDDVAHIFKEIADDQGFPPGFLLVDTPHPCT